MAEAVNQHPGDAHARFLRAQARFFEAAEVVLDAGDRHFDAPMSLAATIAYERARLREREAAAALDAARRALHGL